jgi:hypothetical protein
VQQRLLLLLRLLRLAVQLGVQQMLLLRLLPPLAVTLLLMGQACPAPGCGAGQMAWPTLGRPFLRPLRSWTML